MICGGADMSSLVQRIARQAMVTFRCPPRAAEDGGKSFLENLTRLKSLMTEVRAADLRLVPRRAEDSSTGIAAVGASCLRAAPPVTYMHICATEHFILKVMYGKVRISCFDRLDRNTGTAGSMRRSVLRSCAEYTEDSDACVLAPDRDNLHQIDAVDGPTAFMDILAPPYDPDQGRDCHYYRVLADGGAAGPGPGLGLKQQQEVWLMEISQPPNFWCGGEPYPGPEVHL
uniref:2-aminoethanethiol (cysteamine) dioxygenase b n=1 Tax=Cynoglossus semilaevis TaxID=244447 RepID=A0A3P8UR43_CYNSE